MDRRGKIQLQIRRYVNSILVKQAGNGKPVPLREVALAERFQTTRTTVQRACRELIAEGILTRIPGRAGLFVNNESPACRGPGVDFRILCGTGCDQVFDYAAQCIIDGFSRCFRDFHCGYCYSDLLSSDPAEAARELLEIPCYAYLWIRPAPEIYPVIGQLIDSGFPVVIAASYYDSNVPPPESNAILFDYETPGRERAEWIHKNHFRKPLIYSCSMTTIQALTRRLESYGQKLPPDSEVWFPSHAETKDKLPGIIRSYKPDCFIADGNIFPTFNSLTDDIPELKDIPVYLDNSPRALGLRDWHPELHIHLSKTSMPDFMIQIGDCAARIMRILLKKPGRFQNGKVSDFLDFNESSIQYQPNMKGLKA